MKTQRNVKHFFVAKAITGNKSTTSDRGEQIDIYTDLKDGEIAIVDAGNLVLDTNDTDDEKFRIVQRSGTKLLFSPFIVPENVVNYNITAYVAPVQQVSYIGYDVSASSGSIRVTNSNDYIARITFLESDRVGFGQQLMKYGAYRSDASATQLEVCEGLYKSFIDNFSREPKKDIAFAMVSDAGQTGVGATGAITFTNGSDLVSFTNAVTLTAGSYIRAADQSVHKIKVGASAGTSITLDEAYEGATNSTATGGTAAGTNVGILSGTTGAWGIRMTGLERDFEAGVHKWNHAVPRWDVQLDGFGATESTTPTGANDGNGYWRQMAEEEYLAQGNEGGIYRIGNVPPIQSRQDVDSSTNYDVLTLQYNEKTDTEGMGAMAWSPGEIMIAIADGATQADVATDGFVLVLQGLLSSRMPGYVAQHSKI